MLGTPPVVRSRTLLALGVLPRIRPVACPDNVVRRFWWRRLERGNYDVSHSISPHLPWRFTRPPVPIDVGAVFAVFGDFFLAVIRRC